MITWDIRRDGHAWGGEAMSRYEMTPEKKEMIGGRLYGTEEERLTMLALLLENVGVDKAVRLGNPEIWRAGVAGLNDGREDQEAAPMVVPSISSFIPATRTSREVHRPRVGLPCGRIRREA